MHVDIKPEPPCFDMQVRQKGLSYLKQEGIPMDKPLAKGVKLETYWRACLDDLYKSYEGICAYLCIHLERVTGDASVDHYIAKSQRADLAYEWKNFRLACVRMNTYKREFEDVLDPFEIENGWFHLELTSGRIYANPSLSDEIAGKIINTIRRLRLDEPEFREMRVKRFDAYIMNGISSYHLKKESPLIWH